MFFTGELRGFVLLFLIEILILSSEARPLDKHPLITVQYYSEFQFVMSMDSFDETNNNVYKVEENPKSSEEVEKARMTTKDISSGFTSTTAATIQQLDESESSVKSPVNKENNKSKKNEPSLVIVCIKAGSFLLFIIIWIGWRCSEVSNKKSSSSNGKISKTKNPGTKFPNKTNLVPNLLAQEKSIRSVDTRFIN